MNIKLEKASGRSRCRHLDCDKNPKYISEFGRIIKDTICCKISVGTAAGYFTAFYCRDCLKKIHDEIRVKLNPKLWIFS